eukprot:gene4564-5161_t
MNRIAALFLICAVVVSNVPSTVGFVSPGGLPFPGQTARPLPLLSNPRCQIPRGHGRGNPLGIVPLSVAAVDMRVKSLAVAAFVKLKLIYSCSKAFDANNGTRCCHMPSIVYLSGQLTYYNSCFASNHTTAQDGSPVCLYHCPLNRNGTEFGICAANNSWSEWSAWSNCSHQCFTGTKSRVRSKNIVKYLHGSVINIWNQTETAYCNKRPCLNANVTTRARTRHGGLTFCFFNSTDPVSRFGDCWLKDGKYRCYIDRFALRQAICEPVNGSYSNWTDWSTCSHDCFTGLQTRNRTCINTKYGGTCEYAETTHTRYCNTHSCHDLSNCTKATFNGSETCCMFGMALNNTEIHNECTHERLANNYYCAIDRYSRFFGNCVPIHGEWSQWSNFTDCLKVDTCKNTVKRRHRNCSTPMYNGKPCQGPAFNETACIMENCPPDQSWSDWKLSQPCSVSCGEGKEVWRRDCLDLRGKLTAVSNCEGVEIQTNSCRKMECPGYFLGAIGENCSYVCSKRNFSCRWQESPLPNDYGAELRKLDAGSCSSSSNGIAIWKEDWHPAINNTQCIGYKNVKYSVCTAHIKNLASPVQRLCRCIYPGDLKYSEWSLWSTCSAYCGSAYKTRTRQCVSQNSADCREPFSQNGSCSLPTCPGNPNFAIHSLVKFMAIGPTGPVGLFAARVVAMVARNVHALAPIPCLFMVEIIAQETRKKAFLVIHLTVEFNMVIQHGQFGGNAPHLVAWAAEQDIGHVLELSAMKQYFTQDHVKINHVQWMVDGQITLFGHPAVLHVAEERKHDIVTVQIQSLVMVVHGMWGAWGNWSLCDKPCNNGTMRRTRYCDNPAPKHNGRYCIGQGEMRTSSVSVGIHARFLNETYVEDLANSSSIVFKGLESKIRQNIIQLYRNRGEGIENHVESVKVHFFRNGSVYSNFTVNFTEVSSYELIILMTSVQERNLLDTMPIGHFQLNSNEIPSSPASINAVAVNETCIKVRWSNFNSSILAFNLTAFSVMYRDTTATVWKSLVVPPSIDNILLTRLNPYTLYTLRVTALTYNAAGIPSNLYDVSTLEGVPTKPPSNVSCRATSSSVVFCLWSEIPYNSQNGEVINYIIKYREYSNPGSLIVDKSNPWYNVSFPATTYSGSVGNLKFFTRYELQIHGMTNAGIGTGRWVTVKTEEDVPSSAPLNIKANSYFSTNFIDISWESIPADKWNGNPTAVILKYTITQRGGTTIVGGPMITVEKKHDETFHRINETCRCRQKLYTAWYERNPYVFNKGGTVKGIFPDLLNSMMPQICGNCATFGNALLYFDRTKQGNNAVRKSEHELTSTLSGDAQFNMAVGGNAEQTLYQGQYQYVNIIDSAGSVFVVVDQSKASKTSAIIKSLFGVWPLLVTCLLMMIIAGILLWMLDQFDNPDEMEKGRFFVGSFHGFWWAFVSMTTVGYGDIAPRGSFGRIIGVVWTLVGLVVNGILISSISTALTVITVKQQTMLYGANVSAVFNSSQYILGIRGNANMTSTGIRYLTSKEALDALIQRRVQGTLLELNEAANLQTTISNNGLMIAKLIKSKSGIGLILSGEMASFHAKIRSYVADNNLFIRSLTKTYTNEVPTPAIKARNKSVTAFYNAWTDDVLTYVEEFIEGAKNGVNDMAANHGRERFRLLLKHFERRSFGVTAWIKYKSFSHEKILAKMKLEEAFLENLHKKRRRQTANKLLKLVDVANDNKEDIENDQIPEYKETGDKKILLPQYIERQDAPDEVAKREDGPGEVAKQRKWKKSTNKD